MRIDGLAGLLQLLHRLPELLNLGIANAGIVTKEDNRLDRGITGRFLQIGHELPKSRGLLAAEVEGIFAAGFAKGPAQLEDGNNGIGSFLFLSRGKSRREGESQDGCRNESAIPTT